MWKILKFNSPMILIWLYAGWLYVFGAIIGLSLGISQEFIAPTTITIFLYFAWFSLMASSFGRTLNDYCDRKLDQYNQRKVKYEIVYETQFFSLYIFYFLFPIVSFFLLSIFFFNIFALTYGTILLISNLLYNIPPVRLKERFGWDVIVGPASCLSIIFAGYSLVTSQWPTSWAIIIGVCIFAALEILHKIFDIEADKRFGISTTATRLGFKKALLVCAVLFATAAIIIYIYTKNIFFALLVFSYILLVIRVARITSEEKLILFFRQIKWWYIIPAVIITPFFLYDIYNLRGIFN